MKRIIINSNELESCHENKNTIRFIVKQANSYLIYGFSIIIK